MQIHHNDFAQRNPLLGRRHRIRLDDKPQCLANIIDTLLFGRRTESERVESQCLAGAISEGKYFFRIVKTRGLIVRAAAIDNDIDVFGVRIMVVGVHDLLQGHGFTAARHTDHGNIPRIRILLIRIVKVIAQRHMIHRIAEEHTFGIRLVSPDVLEQGDSLCYIRDIIGIAVHARHGRRIGAVDHISQFHARRHHRFEMPVLLEEIRDDRPVFLDLLLAFAPVDDIRMSPDKHRLHIITDIMACRFHSIALILGIVRKAPVFTQHFQRRLDHGILRIMPGNRDDLVANVRKRQADTQIFERTDRNFHPTARIGRAQHFGELPLMFYTHGTDIIVTGTDIALRSVNIRQEIALIPVEIVVHVIPDVLLGQRLNIQQPGTLQLQIHRIQRIQEMRIGGILFPELLMRKGDKRILRFGIARLTEARVDDEQIRGSAGFHTRPGISLFLPLDIGRLWHTRRIEVRPVITVAAHDDRTPRQILQRHAPDLYDLVVCLRSIGIGRRQLKPVAEYDVALLRNHPVVRVLLDQGRGIVLLVPCVRE